MVNQAIVFILSVLIIPLVGLANLSQTDPGENKSQSEPNKDQENVLNWSLLKSNSEIFVTALHVFQNSKVIENSDQMQKWSIYLAKSKNDEFLDLVFFVSKEKYPSGLNDKFVSSVFANVTASISSFQKRKFVISKVPLAFGQILQNNWSSRMRLDEYGIWTDDTPIPHRFVTRPVLIENKDLQSPYGLSGSLVYGVKYQFNDIESRFDDVIATKLPLGIVKCVVFQETNTNSGTQQSPDVIEVEKFSHIKKFELSTPEQVMKAQPRFSPRCQPTSGRGTGGA